MDRGNVRNTQNSYSKNKFEKLVHLVGFIIGMHSHNFVTQQVLTTSSLKMTQQRRNMQGQSNKEHYNKLLINCEFVGSLYKKCAKCIYVFKTPGLHNCYDRCQDTVNCQARLLFNILWTSLYKHYSNKDKKKTTFGLYFLGEAVKNKQHHTTHLLQYLQT